MPNSFKFPTYTSVSDTPTTYFEELNPEVFNYPFFNQGVSAKRKEYADRKPSTLGESPFPHEDQLLPIKGFVYHTAHCGSTLVGRMLGSSSQVRMISEPEAINGLLLSYIFYKLPKEQVLKQLKKIVEAYQTPGDGKASIIFKLTSWNVYFIDLFQHLFAEIKWIYIDRNTEELVQILKKKDGGFIDWWHHPVDVLRKHFITNSAECTDFESYLLQLVEGHRKHALAAKNEGSMFMHYPDFLNSFPEILAHFGLTFSSSETAAALSFLQFESKVFDHTPFQAST